MKTPSRISRAGAAAAVATALASLAWLAPLRAQGTGPPPRFEAGVEVVRLNVSVTDGQSRLVTGLGRQDFAVFEDGVAQELSLFNPDPLPLSVALLLDCSVSMDQSLRVAQEAGARFLRTLGPSDFGRVTQFNDRTTVLQDFTGDPRRLEDAVRSTRASGPTALYNALYVTLKELQAHRGEEARRLAIVLLSDGEDTASLVTDDQVLALGRQAEVAIYAIGLQADGRQARERPSFGQAKYFLSTLARDTGGQAHFPSSLSELDAVYGRVADELRSQYTLGYLSANARRDGKWRRLVVRVRNRENLRVRHKLGYYTSRG